MPDTVELIRRGVRTVAAVSPRVAGAIARRAFFVTGPRMPLRPIDAATHAAARRSALRIGRHELATYEWGRGDRTALLMHGWRGRSAQFATLVRELVYEGFHVIAFDAPGHGESGGRRTDIRDWLSAADELQRMHGRFHTIVGHSFGALAALTAARSGITTGAIAAISGAASPTAFVGEFSRILDLDGRTGRAFAASFHRHLGEDEASMSAHYDAVAHPLPSRIDLLVIHDEDDTQMPPDDSRRLHAAHGPRSRLLITRGFGHNRVLAADPVLDAVTAFVTGGLPAVDALRAGTTQRAKA